MTQAETKFKGFIKFLKENPGCVVLGHPTSLVQKNLDVDMDPLAF